MKRTLAIVLAVFVLTQTATIMAQDNKTDSLSYALGLSMGNNFRSSGIHELNYEQFAEGVKAVFEGTQPKMTYAEAKEIIRVFFTEMEEQQRADLAAQAKTNQELGDRYLDENKSRQGVYTTPSGLQYEIINEGSGPCPKATDQVKVHYTGSLIDGTVFDSSVERGEPATFGVTQVIPGWVEALQLMKVGSKWRLFIPSNLAYGPNGAGGVIGPNATLIFDVELLEIVK